MLQIRLSLSTMTVLKSDVLNVVRAIRRVNATPHPHLATIVDSVAIGETMEDIFKFAVNNDMPFAVRTFLNYTYPARDNAALINSVNVGVSTPRVWNIIADYVKSMIPTDWTIVNRLSMQLLAAARPSDALVLISECFEEAYLVSGDDRIIVDTVLEHIHSLELLLISADPIIVAGFRRAVRCEKTN